MKYTLRFAILIAFVLVACRPAPTATPSPTATNIPSPTLTSTATATVTPSPTPTLALPVGLKTPVPESNTQITSKNLEDLREIARYYGNLPYIAKLTKDQTRLFVRNGLGMSIYNYETKQLMSQIDLYSQSSDELEMQISDTGEWVIIDGRWLYHLNSDGTIKEVRDMYVELNVDHCIELNLSRDGTKLAIHKYSCKGSPLDTFYIRPLA